MVSPSASLMSEMLGKSSFSSSHYLPATIATNPDYSGADCPDSMIFLTMSRRIGITLWSEKFRSLTPDSG